MIRRFTLLFLLGTVCLSSLPDLCLANMNNYELFPIVKKGISYLIQQQYHEADSCWNSFPPDPKYDLERIFYPTLTIVARYPDLEKSLITEKEFFVMVENSIDKGKERLKVDPNDIFAHFYLGYSYAFYSMYYYYIRSLPSVIAYGVKAISELKKCVELDSTFIEPYISLGSYTYWRSSFARKLFIPFSGGGRDKGIEMIKRGLNSSIGDYLARDQLVWIYIDYKKYEEAINAARIALERYPGNRLLQWALVIAYRKEKRYDEALDVLNQIGESLKHDGYGKETSYSRTLLYRAELQYKKEDYTRVSSLCLFFLTGSSSQFPSPAKGPTHLRFCLRHFLTLGGFGGFGSFHKAG